MEKINKLILTAISIAVLTGCGSKGQDGISKSYYKFINSATSVDYSVEIDADYASTDTGITDEITLNSKSDIQRILSTGDLHDKRSTEYNFKGTEDSESAENYVVAGKRYTTFDGYSFFTSNYSMDQQTVKGPFAVLDQIMGDKEANTSDSTFDENKAIEMQGTLKGPYIPYLIDDIDMSGILNFKQLKDKEISIDYEVYLDTKNKKPLGLVINCKDGMPDVLNEMVNGQNSSAIIAINKFRITYKFNDYNSINSIELPEGAATAKELDNIDSMSKSLVDNTSLENVTITKVNLGNFSFDIYSSWIKTDDLVKNAKYKAGDANNKVYSDTKYKFANGESYITAYNPSVFNELYRNITGESPEEDVDADTVAKLVLDKYSDDGYEIMDIPADGEIPRHILASENNSDTKTSKYDIFIIGEDEFLEIEFSLAGDELYQEDYKNAVSKVLDSMRYNPEEIEEKPSPIEEETKEDESKKPGEGTEEPEALKGTIKNPYKYTDIIDIAGIDITSANTVTEHIKVKNFTADKILAEQKLKSLGIESNGDAALVVLEMSVDKLKYTTESTLTMNLEMELVDREGNQIGEKLHDGKSVDNDDMTFTEDNEKMTASFVFNLPDNFDKKDGLLQLTYMDMNLGQKNVYIELQ